MKRFLKPKTEMNTAPYLLDATERFNPLESQDICQNFL